MEVSKDCNFTEFTSLFPVSTKVGTDGVHVGVVALAGSGITGAVAVGEESRCVVSYEGEEKHGGGANDPSELTGGPGQREHSRADDRSYDVSACSPHSACKDDIIREQKNYRNTGTEAFVISYQSS